MGWSRLLVACLGCAVLLSGAARSIMVLGLLAVASTALALQALGAVGRARRAEAERDGLADEARRWRSVVEAGDQAVAIATPGGTVKRWTAAAERLFGWRRDEILGRSLLAVVAPERRAEVSARLARGVGRQGASFECVGLRRDGARVDVAVTIVPLPGTREQGGGVAVLWRDVGARKSLEAACRRLERDYDELVEHADDGVFLADPEGRLVRVNQAGARLLGVSPEQLVGRSLAAFMADEEAQRLANARAALVPGVPHVGHVPLRRADGGWLVAELRMVLLGDGRVQSFVRDLGARETVHAELARAHAAERGLRVQLQSLSQATSAITDAVARIPESDLDAVLMVIVLQAQTLTNARYAALGLGTDPARPFERWVYAGVTAEQAERIGRAPRPVGLLGAVALQGRAVRLRDVGQSRERVGFPPGHPPMHSFLGVPILYEGRSRGNLYLADKQGGGEFTAEDQQALELLAARAGTALETARLYHEKAQATTWLRGAIDGLPEAVILAEVGGQVSLNAAARELATAEVAGTPARLELYDSRGAPLADEEHPLFRALHGEVATIGLECCGQNRRGQRVPLLASASPLRDERGRPLGAVCVLRDISSFKEIERLREQWTAVVAHELRQPVQMIHVCARTIERAGASERDPLTAKSATRILAAAARLERMIKDLLDAARIEARQLALRCETIDLGAVLAEVVARLGQTTDRSLRLEVDPLLPPVRGDAGRIEQIVENLLTNALKYGDPGAPIAIEVRPHGREVLVSTTNQGQRLPPAEIDCLFKRFYRSRAVAAVEGLGLGLYIAHGLIEAHGGRIWVESGDASTSFRFTLPAAPPQDGDDEGGGRSDAPPRDRQGSGGREQSHDRSGRPGRV
ncbi:PAS domain S-box-containing protein [Nannocystis exedens]|uniref:histidine kinase n=1 Tax=Nannocystis exedens TaxID=54 RepID=A0A1I2HMH7_9BACT|nr:PAS domain S-box protein [Nannocystis exedens]PCC71982.1 Alkaline phosphatase synthesis sensor protein PhoR [Nannocystis exedens]SFF30500.1 PAS domain S-box-containing protein [Nannocystis exedens]